MEENGRKYVFFLEPNVILSKIRKVSVGHERHEQYYDS